MSIMNLGNIEITNNTLTTLTVDELKAKRKALKEKRDNTFDYHKEAELANEIDRIDFELSKR